MTVTWRDVLAVLHSKRSFLAKWTAIGCLVLWPAVWLLPKSYVATAVIIPPQQQPSSAALLASFSTMGALAARDFGLKNPADIYVGLLAGRTLADAVIDRFRLQDAYGKSSRVETRHQLARKTTFLTGRDTLIRISVEDRDPRRAADIANAYVSELQKQSTRLAMSEASERRQFFERQVEAEKVLLAQAEADLKSTQERTGLVQVNSQAEASMRAIAQTRALITAREVHLQSLRLSATEQNPDVLRAKAELEALRRELGTLEARSGGGLISPNQLPASGLEYLRRMRELKYREAVVELLLKQYEVARFDEAKAAPTIQVVDRAVPADLPAWPPKAAFLVVIALLIATSLSTFVVAGASWKEWTAASHRTERVVVRQL